jgi:hypothetical protein
MRDLEEREADDSCDAVDPGFESEGPTEFNGGPADPVAIDADA